MRISAMWLVLLFIMGGCTNAKPQITEEQAIQTVIDFHSHQIGKMEIQEVTHANHQYFIEWTNEENCESGKAWVDDQTGEIERSEQTIC
ncbi:hypothetical protein QWY16_03485 [Planococcus shenhongbingii]|uniref:hypothetical protein n=1 Tax=Planococcus shenhongbingii TaxID=3058398 RepID=UPI00262A0DEB|nr:hypothetical protein [Planococcus sp. N016]WKA59229.1 hypothetical protein QWY16_03485 [Planococcus sp. N016]